MRLRYLSLFVLIGGYEACEFSAQGQTIPYDSRKAYNRDIVESATVQLEACMVREADLQLKIGERNRDHIEGMMRQVCDPGFIAYAKLAGMPPKQIVDISERTMHVALDAAISRGQ